MFVLFREYDAWIPLKCYSSKSYHFIFFNFVFQGRQSTIIGSVVYLIYNWKSLISKFVFFIYVSVLLNGRAPLEEFQIHKSLRQARILVGPTHIYEGCWKKKKISRFKIKNNSIVLHLQYDERLWDQMVLSNFFFINWVFCAQLQRLVPQAG